MWPEPQRWWKQQQRLHTNDWMFRKANKGSLKFTGLLTPNWTRGLRPWVCDAGREDLEGPALTSEMGRAGHRWGRGSLWRACWPGGPGAAAPPPPASGGAAPLQPDPHQQPPRTACRNKRRGLLLAEQSQTVKNVETHKPKCYEVTGRVCTQHIKSRFLSPKWKMWWEQQQPSSL